MVPERSGRLAGGPRTRLRGGIRSGPMSLLVLALMLCLATLAALALATAAADERRAERQVAMAEDSYANEACGQELLAAADAAVAVDGVAGLARLAEEVPDRWPGASASFDGTALVASFEQPSGRSLDVSVSVGDDGALVVDAWSAGVRWEEPEVNLWQGP